MTDISQPKNEVELKDAVTELLRRVRHERSEWDGAIATLRAYIEGPIPSVARHIIGDLNKREPLELQWRVDELLEATAPPPPPAPPKADPEPELAAEAEAETETTPPLADSGVVAPLRPEDLVVIYDDPRGLLIHRHAIDGRWFLTQVNPMNGQPQTMELSTGQRGQVQQELAGSPHWIEKEWDVIPSPTSPII